MTTVQRALNELRLQQGRLASLRRAYASRGLRGMPLVVHQYESYVLGALTAYSWALEGSTCIDWGSEL